MKTKHQLEEFTAFGIMGFQLAKKQKESLTRAM